LQGEFVGIDFPAAASNTPLWGVHLPTLQTKGDKLMHYDRIDYQTFSEELISLRREFHKYPENAWTEYRTTVRIIQELASLGIPFWYGRKIHTAGERNNLPAPEVDRLCIERAIRETGEEALIREMSSGYTGVVAFIEGNISGPTVAIRCDIDCNDLQEDLSSEHRPFREGFSSTHENLMHACGHDSHAAIGIGTARILHAYKDRLKGKVVLIFQPAEEGNRGAISMVGSGILKDMGIDYMFAGHGGGLPLGEISASVKNFAIGYKINFTFKGASSHAGGAPQNGRNALAAACTASLGLLGISRSGDGWSRVNVGYLQSGTGRNVIPKEATMWLEVRGESEKVRDYMFDRALKVGKGAAEMYDCEFSYEIKGQSRGIDCDSQLVDLIEEVAARADGVTKVNRFHDFKGGGDDVTHIMHQIQEQGGLVDYIQFGSSAVAPLHSSKFDIDESVIPLIAKLYCDIVFALGSNGLSKKEDLNSND